MLTKTQKNDAVTDLGEKFSRATSVFVADYRGLDVGAQNELRGQLRGLGESECEYRVAKNSLLKLASEVKTLLQVEETSASKARIEIIAKLEATISNFLILYQ